MTKSSTSVVFLLGTAIAAGAAFFAGCGGYGPDDYCNDACDCMGCSTRTHNDCVDYYTDLENRADRDGCGDRWDDAAACASDTGHCTSRGDWVTDCDPENEALVRCMGTDFHPPL